MIQPGVPSGLESHLQDGVFLHGLVRLEERLMSLLYDCPDLIQYVSSNSGIMSKRLLIANAYFYKLVRPA